jgi:hypothetical protein
LINEEFGVDLQEKEIETHHQVPKDLEINANESVMSPRMNREHYNGDQRVINFSTNPQIM